MNGSQQGKKNSLHHLWCSWFMFCLTWLPNTWFRNTPNGPLIEWLSHKFSSLLRGYPYVILIDSKAKRWRALDCNKITSPRQRVRRKKRLLKRFLILLLPYCVEQKGGSIAKTEYSTLLCGFIVDDFRKPVYLIQLVKSVYNLWYIAILPIWSLTQHIRLSRMIQ
jgi:hypothetical protein